MKKIIIGLLFLASVLSLNSCDKKIRGCTDPTSTNYNAEANEDDGSCTYAPAYTIGKSYQGGYIAYILQQGDYGYDPNEKHGLIAALYDQTTGPWGCYGTSVPGTSTAFGTGQANTTLIINTCPEAGIAARLCDDLILGGYSDWYLPSKDELHKLFLNQVAIGGFSSGIYWTSSQYSLNQAWYQEFSTGNIGAAYDKTMTYYVRAIRTF